MESEFILFNTKIMINNLKIDTGCGFTTFPLKTLGAFTSAEANQFKLNDIRNQVKYTLSYGVETGGQNIKTLKQNRIKCNVKLWDSLKT